MVVLSEFELLLLQRFNTDKLKVSGPIPWNNVLEHGRTEEEGGTVLRPPPHPPFGTFL